MVAGDGVGDELLRRRATGHGGATDYGDLRCYEVNEHVQKVRVLTLVA